MDPSPGKTTTEFFSVFVGGLTSVAAAVFSEQIEVKIAALAGFSFVSAVYIVCRTWLKVRNL